MALVAAALRLPNLGRPHALVFDETYYVKDAWSLLKFGYERRAVEGANELLLAGGSSIHTDQAAFVVHPPLGKWVIALGEWLFGLNPFGWRIVVAVLGVAAVVILHRTARRLFRHELTAALAGLFMAIDGMAIVHSRTALLDQSLMFFGLVGFAAVVLDRDMVRERLQGGPSTAGTGFRPWLLVAVASFALASAVKWSGLWLALVGGLLVVFFTARSRISQGHGRAWLRAIVRDTAPWLPVSLALFLAIYLAAWSGWLLSVDGWGRTWAESHPGELTWLPEGLRALAAYHQSAWNFHVNLHSPHSYAANPWTWPLQLRPTSFFYESYGPGQAGCVSGSCAAEVIPLGNPLIWWAGTIALLHQAWRALVRREGRAVAIFGMSLAGWAPWLLYQQRTVFAFYAIAFAPYLYLALAGSIGTYLGDPDDSRLRRRRAFIAGGFVLAVVVLSWFFLPIWTGETISYRYWQLHMWLPTWI